MRIRILLLAVCLGISIQLSSQTSEHVKAPYPDEVTIGAATVARDGRTLIVDYSIRLGANVRWCKVDLYQSTDGGKTFTNISSSKGLSGDLGKISESGTKEIRYDISNVKEQLSGKRLVYKVEVKNKDIVKRELLLSGVASLYPNMSYGVMIGTVKKAGFYLKARSDFNFISSSYSCNSDGDLETGGKIWTTGVESRSRMVVTGGMIFHVRNWLYPYIGAGYGSKQLYIQDTQNNWATVSDLSYQGVSLDAGFLFKFNKIVLSAAVCNTAFKYTEAEIGIGLMF